MQITPRSKQTQTFYLSSRKAYINIIFNVTTKMNRVKKAGPKGPLLWNVASCNSLQTFVI